ncbi:hypothetical protein [Vulcanisaeta distributa]|uniref:hypothetical protein n=1 Tax=Vulcanisaeta distributa TaxID=164451 RepID=UPI000ABFB08D|nr:hypothetical protein [Vulcanisaeta distributa]
MSTPLPSLGVLGIGLFGGIAASVLIHGFVKYLHGPTPEVRREGFDEVVDVVVGSVMLGTLYTLLLISNFLPILIHGIASSIPINNSTSLSNYLQYRQPAVTPQVGLLNSPQVLR